MENNKKILIFIGLVVIIGVGYLTTQNSGNTEVSNVTDTESSRLATNNTTNEQVDPPSLELEAGAEAEEKEMMDDEEDDMMDGDDMEYDAKKAKEDAMMKLSGEYLDYTPELVATSKAEHTVLFFHATWCPSCRTLDKIIEGGEVPDGISILKVDYDTNTDLRKKYAVTTQPTLVEVPNVPIKRRGDRRH